MVRNSQIFDYSLQKLGRYAQLLKKGAVDNMTGLTTRIQIAKLDRKAYLMHRNLVDYSNKGFVGLKVGMSAHALSIKLGLDSDPLIDKSAEDLHTDYKVLNYCSSLQDLWINVKDTEPSNVWTKQENKAIDMVSHGLLYHAYGIKTGILEQPASLNMIMTFYGKFAIVEESIKIFKSIQEKNHLIYSSIITSLNEGSSLDGKTKVALVHSLLGQIVKIGINMEYIYSPILTLYERQGLLYEAQSLFDEIPKPNLTHYSILVHLLGKLGMFDEALDLLNKMPYSKDEAILTALLHGCVLHNNIPLGLHLAKQLEMLNPNEPAASLLPQKLLASVDPMKAEDYRHGAIGITRPGVSFIC